MSNLIEATTVIFEELSALPAQERQRVLAAVGLLLDGSSPIPLPPAAPPAAGFDRVKSATAAPLPKGDGRGRSGRSEKVARKPPRPEKVNAAELERSFLNHLKKHADGIAPRDLAKEMGIDPTDWRFRVMSANLTQQGKISATGGAKTRKFFPVTE